MKNPLIRRIPRELKADWHKYIVIIIFMVMMIGVISGMYVGHDSMLSAVYTGRKELNLEDGSFELSKRASQSFIDDISTGEMADVRQYYIDKGNKEADKEVAEAIEEAFAGFPDEVRETEEYKKAVEEAYEEAHNTVVEKVDEEWGEIVDRYNLDEDFKPVAISVYENFYRDAAEDYNNDGTEDATVRVFKSDSTINMASFNKGRAPENDTEIAIDRMHADNVGIKIGDSITVGGKKFEVVGLLSYVDYLTLHESNTDLMFDAFGFDVAMVTPEAFNKLTARVHYNYAYKYVNEPEDKIQKADYANALLKALITQTLVHDTEIEDFLPEYLRQASNFAPSDIEHDSAGTSILCYILIGVIAFIFAITISNTIDKESAVIGTLRASGYSKRELVNHYMSMPLIVTIIGAVLGNVLGYTAFRTVAVNLYYESYSLPTCHLVWSNTALIKTTIIPLVLMFCINLIVIVRKMQLSPLRFLRHDLVRTRRTKARRLPSWSFLRRFRLRILFQNMPNYVVLAVGVVLIELMLCFAFGLPDSLSHYSKSAPDMMFAEYQYMLMDSKDEDGNVIKTREETAETFSSKNLLYLKNAATLFSGMGSGKDESVTVYGIADNSEYVKLESETSPGEGYVSSAFMAKFGLKVGDTITLHEEYENKSYDFTVLGSVDYDGGIALFMGKKSFDAMFDKEDGDFSGFFSCNEISDVDEQSIATVITAEDITKVTVQLDHSMGGFMDVFKYALVVLAAALIYLLAKIIIEKNEQSISMVKILGFMNTEIGSLYIVPTAIMVIIFAIAGFAAGYYLMIWIFQLFMLQMDGYFVYYMKPISMVLSVVYLLVGYAVVSAIDYFRIKRIPMDVALKNVE
ncbi:ABC transporter permease [Butyrivibrio sp. VCB2006]|uniref:ABC transporter permease n=1 Tax=Butyrivibrio sp. VCB2006 TaxID=1280679 RepID=UPI0004186A16|nr:ABC transporter permease [Butyrivibrio sp. VCB2006]